MTSDLQELQKQILKFRDERDWKQFHNPKDLALSLVLEATEVLELFQWSKDNNLPEDKRKDLQDEMADVFGYLMLLAHATNIDLSEAFEQKMKLNSQKYPVEKSKGKSTKYTNL